MISTRKPTNRHWSKTMTIKTTQGRAKRYDSILDTIGDTPAIRINRIAPKHVNVSSKPRPSTPVVRSKTAWR